MENNDLAEDGNSPQPKDKKSESSDDVNSASEEVDSSTKDADSSAKDVDASAKDVEAQQIDQGASEPVKDPALSSPPWVKRIVKLMVLFAILGCILLCLGALLINRVLHHALSGHGM